MRIRLETDISQQFFNLAHLFQVRHISFIVSHLLVEFWVPGVAKTAGSKKAFLHPHTRKIIVTDDSGKPGKLWREFVKLAAAREYSQPPATGPLALFVVFYVARPKSHFGTGRNRDTLKASAPQFPIVLPDTTKLLRSVEDACTKILWKDDAQIVNQSARKRYCDESHPQSGVWLRVETVEEEF